MYYNGELQGLDAAKPVLEIGEPFDLAFEMTVKQDCQVLVEISELGEDDFEIIEGKTDFDEYDIKIYAPNETYRYEWTLKPTDNWAGGTMPIDIRYNIYVKDQYDPIVNAGFTALYPYISTEYYEGKPTPEEPTEIENKQTPAFTLPSALLAIALLATYNRHKK